MPRARKISPVSVVRAAARLVRRDGLDAVSVRAVAASLDVTPMALYRHVGSAAGLRTATLEFILLEVKAPPPEGRVTDRLRVFAHEARAVFGRYPGVAEAVLTEWPRLLQGARIMESLLATTADATRSRARRVDIANAVFVYVLMRAVAERSVLAGGRRRGIPTAQAHPDRFPELAAAQGYFAEIDTDRHFAIGIDALLRGMVRGDR